MTRRRIDSFFSGLIKALTGAPRYLCLPNVPFPPSSDKKAAGVLGTSSTGNVIDSCRCIKEFTAEVTFTCSCSIDARGLLTMQKDGFATILCQECGLLHHSAEFVIANTGADCKHPVRTFDPREKEYTCVECGVFWSGNLRTTWTSLPDGNAVGDVAGSGPPEEAH